MRRAAVLLACLALCTPAGAATDAFHLNEKLGGFRASLLAAPTSPELVLAADQALDCHDKFRPCVAEGGDETALCLATYENALATQLYREPAIQFGPARDKIASPLKTFATQYAQREFGAGETVEQVQMIACRLAPLLTAWSQIVLPKNLYDLPQSGLP